MNKRTDIHKPSVINPEEYRLVTYTYTGYDPFESMEYQGWQKVFNDDMKSTGGKFGKASKSGCSVCGASFSWGAIYHHEPSNEYIHVGHICADKMDLLNGTEFRSWKTKISTGLKLKAGKHKAKELLEEEGLSRAWELSWEADDTIDPEEFHESKRRGLWTLRDIVSRLVRYGSLSDKQLSLLHKLVEQIDKPVEKKDPGKHVGTVGKRCSFDMELVKVTRWDGMYGWTTLYIMKDEEGNTIIWKTSSGSLIVGNSEWYGDTHAKEGDKFRINAYVKDHTEYNRVNQTVVSRVKVEEVRI